MVRYLVRLSRFDSLSRLASSNTIFFATCDEAPYPPHGAPVPAHLIRDENMFAVFLAFSHPSFVPNSRLALAASSCAGASRGKAMMTWTQQAAVYRMPPLEIRTRASKRVVLGGEVFPSRRRAGGLTFSGAAATGETRTRIATTACRWGCTFRDGGSREQGCSLGSVNLSGQ